VPLPPDFEGVSKVTASDGQECPFEVREGMVRVQAAVPSVGFCGLRLHSGAAPSEWKRCQAATLENEWIRLELDQAQGLAKVEWKPTGTALLENAGDWLIAQWDTGNFQIENPSGAEVAASSGSLRLEQWQASPLGQTARLSGEFPPLAWAGKDSHLRWQAEFFVPTGQPQVLVVLHLDWKGEATRLRFTLPSTLDTATGIYEVPFGVVSRKPYSPRTNAKGEWPAHRFVAMESGGHGLALANSGMGGVEVSGGTLYSTLLRAPKSEYAGMVADSTSSQHGKHEYRFGLVPYEGSWAEAEVASFAQELNNPILIGELCDATASPASLFQLEPANVILSSIKAAEDGSGDVIVRVYEAASRATQASWTMPGVNRVWDCDLQENKSAELANSKGTTRFEMQPFEIKTFRAVCNA